MTTMRDVAALAGVSAKTVSRVFNGEPNVLAETRRQVEKAMVELNYVPNGLATTFRAGRSSVIGVAVPDISDPFFASIARSIDDVARHHKMSTLVASLSETNENEQSIIESLLGFQLSGLVICPVGKNHSWLEKWKQHTPIVFVDRLADGIQADSFIEDDEKNGYLATKHLIDHGHRRIAYLGDRVQLITEALRIEGWKRALREIGEEPVPELLVSAASNVEQTRIAIDRLMSLPNPPTAVFSGNPRCTMALAHVESFGSFALVSLGDFPLSQALSPTITVIDQNPAELGKLAAERVIYRLNQKQPSAYLRTVLDVKLIERESCMVR